METRPVKNILPPLKPLRAFASVAYTKSFTATGKDMHLSQSAVSNQIKKLEEHLKVTLFERYPNRLVLTRLGELYAEPVQQALKLLSEATLEVLRQQQGIELKVHIPGAFMDWLEPRLAKFQTNHPGIRFCFQSLESMLFQGETVDVAIVQVHSSQLACDTAHVTVHRFDKAPGWCLVCLSERVTEHPIQAFSDWLLAEVQHFSVAPKAPV